MMDKKLMNSKATSKLRNIVFKIYKVCFNVEKLFERAEVCEIGFTGNISAIDRDLAKEKGLKPLNKFEKWLIQPIIQLEKRHRQYVFAKSAAEYLGEDINDWL